MQPKNNRLVRKPCDAELSRQFSARQGGSDDANVERSLGTADTVSQKIDRQGGIAGFPDRSNKLWKIFWPILSVMVAAGIFFSSSISGDVSGNASMTITMLVRFLSPVGDETLRFMHFLVRKAAHFTVFLVLAFCVAQSLKFYLHKLRTLFFSAWSIAAAYGVADEIHQFFVPGRVMAISDMLINAAGAFFGAAIVIFILRR